MSKKLWKRLLPSMFIVVALPVFSNTINGTISGTCGFYQGALANVVYSEAFSGDGTFCTAFAAGGSFTNTGVLQAGDVSSLAHSTILAFAPAGYGVFVNIATTFSVTQQYLLTPAAPPPTATGIATTFIGGISTTDDGSGLGSCSEHVSLNVAGFSTPNGLPISIPITFGQPISVTQTATITCHDYAPPGIAFGDDGVQEFYAGVPFLLYDANGNFLGTASLTTVVPEPSSAACFALASMLLIFRLFRSNRDERGS